MNKLSENFLEFIEPLLEVFGDPVPRTLNHDAACALGHVVWNAVAMESLHPGRDYLTAAKAQCGNVPDIDSLFDRMAKRKRELFGSDQRIIGVYDIVEKSDKSFALQAQAIDGKSVN